MSHQKRSSSSKKTLLTRKGTTFISCQSPGPHKKAESMPLNVVIRDILKLVETGREAKKSLNAGLIFVNGVAIKDHRFPIGFLDEISFTTSKDKHIVIYNTLGKLELKKQEKDIPKTMKVIGKKILHKGKTQINLFTGKNILLEKTNGYSVGDSIVIEKNKVVKHLKFEKGAKVFLTSGKQVGYNGVIEEIKKNKNWSQPKTIMVKTKNGIFETLKECAYVVDGEL